VRDAARVDYGKIDEASSVLAASENPKRNANETAQHSVTDRRIFYQSVRHRLEEIRLATWVNRERRGTKAASIRLP
jgi:hypothetical protein